MSITRTYAVQGMHCASCAAIIEKTLRKLPGVEVAEVNFGTETARVAFGAADVGTAALAAAVAPLGYVLVERGEGGAGRAPTSPELPAEHPLRPLAPLLAMAAVSLGLMAWEGLAALRVLPMFSETAKGFVHHLLPLFATYAFATAGRPYLAAIGRFFRHGVANMDTLIGIGTAAAFLYSFVLGAFETALAPYLDVSHTYYDVVIVVVAFVALGKALEAGAKKKTGEAVRALLGLQAKEAVVLRGGVEVSVPLADVAVGDRVVVKPAGRIPVDGTVVEGASYVDESMVTGEPVPVEKTAGAAVVAGTLNTTGAFVFEAKKVGGDTLLAQIVRLVDDAQASKAPIQALADRIAAVFVPVVMGIAVVALLAWLAFGTGPLGFSGAVSHGLAAFVGVLVIACPCALGLATPTAVMVGVGKGAREGILVKDAATLERLRAATVVLLDKTGTITNGRPEVVAVRPVSIGADAFVARLAALEARSEHPLAQAVLGYARAQGIHAETAEGFLATQGKGVEARLGGVRHLAGNGTFLADHGVTVDPAFAADEARAGRTPVFLAADGTFLGAAFIADAPKPEARQAVADLKARGLRVVMLSGDDRRTAEAVAAQVGIDEVVAGVLPAGKRDTVRAWQEKGEVVAMVGDGVNDAPALAQADVGIAMAGGTDVAIASAGITLLGGDLSKLRKAVRLSDLTIRGIRQNLFWAFAYNLVGIPLAAGLFFPLFGWTLNPVFAGAAMAFSSLSVVLNSLRLKTLSL